MRSRLSVLVELVTNGRMVERLVNVGVRLVVMDGRAETGVAVVNGTFDDVFGKFNKLVLVELDEGAGGADRYGIEEELFGSKLGGR